MLRCFTCDNGGVRTQPSGNPSSRPYSGEEWCSFGEISQVYGTALAAPGATLKGKAL